MNNLCSSLQSAGTVNTHLILVLTTLPTYSFNLANALLAMYFRVSLMTGINGISRLSIERALLCM
jgi:hypothetical protein